jgi:hypothetical protein
MRIERCRGALLVAQRCNHQLFCFFDDYFDSTVYNTCDNGVGLLSYFILFYVMSGVMLFSLYFLIVKSK